jgi:hypothetical protein
MARQAHTVSPHRGSKTCRSCGVPHPLNEHWSHAYGPHRRPAEHSYLRKRKGLPPFETVPRKKKAGTKKVGRKSAPKQATAKRAVKRAAAPAAHRHTPHRVDYAKQADRIEKSCVSRKTSKHTRGSDEWWKETDACITRKKKNLKERTTAPARRKAPAKHKAAPQKAEKKPVTSRKSAQERILLERCMSRCKTKKK